MRYVEQAAQAIRPLIENGNLIILESTSPPGTSEELVLKYAVPDGMKVGHDVFIAHCPERVLPGRILLEVVQNDRIVGGVTDECTDRARAFYESFVSGNVLSTTARVAELTKLVENSYRDVNIAFANELSIIADRLNVDAWEVIELANRHPRVNILNPGPGVGGHCISVDPWFLVSAMPDITPLIHTARKVNQTKPHHVVERVVRLASALAKPVIGCLGLTYKADVDDLRESPSVDVVRELKQRNIGDVMVCDPLLDEVRYTEHPLSSLEEVLEKAHVLGASNGPSPIPKHS